MHITAAKDQLETNFRIHFKEIDAALKTPPKDWSERQAKTVLMVALYGMGRFLEDQEKTDERGDQD